MVRRMKKVKKNKISNTKRKKCEATHNRRL
jgi:hypothetical protein